MGKYVEQNLNKNETLIKKIELSKVPLIVKWVKAALMAIVTICCMVLNSNAKKNLENAADEAYDSFGDILDNIVDLFLVEFLGSMLWLLIVICLLLVWGGIKAIILYMNTEMGFTNRRVIGKTGVINTQAMDTPLDKVQNVTVSSGLFGKIFHYGKIKISLASMDTYVFNFVVEPDVYKKALMQQIDQYTTDKIDEQAQRTAQAMAQAQAQAQAQANNGQ